MAITTAHERPQPPTGTAFSDAVTFAFGDVDSDVFAMVRIGLAAAGADGPQSSGLAVVFSGGQPVAVRAAGGLAMAEPTFEAVDAAGVRAQTVVPLQEWTVQFESEDGSVALDLRFAALSDPGEIAADSPVASAGGMQGYEQLCHVTGTARVRGGTRTVHGLGQRGHSWGAPDWDRITVARSVSAWMGDDLAVSATAVRAKKASSHADEALAATIFVRAPDGEGPAAVILPEEARLSTTYDSEGRQRRAGLELYETQGAYPRRGAGDVLCGTSLDLGRLRLDCAFFRWRLDGRDGVGRYDILRRADA